VRLVIVEDELIVAEDLRLTLDRLGFQVVGTFNTGEKAIREVARLLPSLTLMDIRLSSAVDGIEAARAIRNLGIRVVFFTAHTDEVTLARAREVASGFVFKPFTEIALVKAIDAGLGWGQNDEPERSRRGG
jgi:DNA-binding NarL/FixJ family response regulator